MARWSAQLILLACLSVASACKVAEPHDDILLLAPPVVPRALLASAQVDDHNHEHATISTAPSTNGPVAVQAALSHAFYTKAVPERLILKIDLAAAVERPQKRRPLNLALVIDRSASMDKDQKFTYAMEAAGLVVENLSNRDVISLITFNQTATVLSPAGRAVNKEFLHYRFGQFGPSGYTNLSAALLEAFAQIESQSADGQLKRVIALTDGQANRGVTDPKKLRILVASAHARGISLSTLGCGTEFNEEILTSLAEAGGGRYTYIRSPEQIPGAIATELNGLLDVVAQNARLEVRAASGGVIARVYGRLIDEPMSSYLVELGDIRDGEHSTFLMEISPSAFQAGATVGVDVTLTLDNPETGSREQQVFHPQAAFSTDAGQARRSENDRVMMYAGVLDAMEKAEEAIQGLDIERFRETKRIFERLYEDVHRHALETRDQQLLNQTFLLKHFMAELSAASESALMHDHRAARKRIKKDVNYRRYLLEHHRGHQEP